MGSLQNELDYSGKEPSMSPRAQNRHQHSQATPQLMSSGISVSSGPSGQSTGQGTRSEHCDQQSRNSVFSNALSSPIRRSLQHYHIAQGGGFGSMPPAIGSRNNDPNFLQHQNRDSNSSNDSSMDMHAD